MIGLMMLTAATIYGLFARFVVRRVYAGTGSVKMKWIAIAVFWLIPTWDIILGYPIYLYLCHFKAGVKIYRTVDNVEGIYVGEKNAYMSAYNLYPGFERYRYIDYKDQNTPKYFRLYWLENNTDKNCLPTNHKYDWYADVLKTGRCIARKEIPEEQVSRWGYFHDSFNNEDLLGILNFTRENTIVAKDIRTGERLGETICYAWEVGWLNRSLFLLVVGTEGAVGCFPVRDSDILYKVFKPIKYEDKK